MSEVSSGSGFNSRRSIIFSNLYVNGCMKGDNLKWHLQKCGGGGRSVNRGDHGWDLKAHLKYCLLK